MTALHGWGLPEQHLAMDALVAFVDGELTPSAYDRAAAHIARCSTCSSEAAVQRNARTAVRSAHTPAMSSTLLHALHSIPSETELPAQPDGLALSEDGQLVTANRRERSARFGTGPVLGSSTPLGGGTRLGVPTTPASTTSSSPGSSAASASSSPTAQGTSGEGTTPAEPGNTGSTDDRSPDHPQSDRHTGRRTRQGASVVFSGIVLGALALINLPADDDRDPTTFSPRTPEPGDTYSNGTVPTSHNPAEPRLPQVAAHTSVIPESPATTASRP